MKNDLPRLLLSAKDIMRITGQSERSARRLIAAIKKANHKGSGKINLDEFCAFTGLREERVMPYLI